jgi:aquaporin Z
MQTARAERAALFAVRANLRVYAMDGALLGIFMVSACLSVALIEHPAAPIRRLVDSDFVRRALIGTAMGLTAVALIYSPWGKRSGAFMNPAVTLCFLRLGKLPPLDAAGYIVAQLTFGTFGVAVSSLLLGDWLSDPAVNYVVTAPGKYGVGAAWLAEFAIAFVMLTVVIRVNQNPRLVHATGFFAAALVALFITFEAPASGMSLNPARSFASAVVANSWSGWWIYLTAPILGMLAGAELSRLLAARRFHVCGKLNHSRAVPCFVRCNCLEEARSEEP